MMIKKGNMVKAAIFFLRLFGFPLFSSIDSCSSCQVKIPIYHVIDFRISNAI